MKDIFNIISKIRIKDSIVLSLISGLIGTIAMDLSNFLLWRSKKSEVLYGHLAGSMIMRSFRTNQTKNFVLGQIFHLFSGATLGIPLYAMLKRTGKDYHLLKGAFMGMLTWGFLYNFGQRFRLFSTRTKLAKSHYSALWNNLLYGITTAELIVRFADVSLFVEQSQQQQENRQNERPKVIAQEFMADEGDTSEKPLPLH